MEPIYKTSGNSIGGPSSLTPMATVSNSKPQSELEREFNTLNQATEYLASRVGILESKLSPILMPESPNPLNDKIIEPSTVIGKAIRNQKDIIDTQIFRLESLLSRISL